MPGSIHCQVWKVSSLSSVKYTVLLSTFPVMVLATPGFLFTSTSDVRIIPLPEQFMIPFLLVWASGLLCLKILILNQVGNIPVLTLSHMSCNISLLCACWEACVASTWRWMMEHTPFLILYWWLLVIAWTQAMLGCNLYGWHGFVPPSYQPLYLGTPTL